MVSSEAPKKADYVTLSLSLSLGLVSCVYIFVFLGLVCLKDMKNVLCLGKTFNRL